MSKLSYFLATGIPLTILVIGASWCMWKMHKQERHERRIKQLEDKTK